MKINKQLICGLCLLASILNAQALSVVCRKNICINILTADELAVQKANSETGLTLDHIKTWLRDLFYPPIIDEPTLLSNLEELLDTDSLKVRIGFNEIDLLSVDSGSGDRAVLITKNPCVIRVFIDSKQLIFDITVSIKKNEPVISNIQEISREEYLAYGSAHIGQRRTGTGTGVVYDDEYFKKHPIAYVEKNLKDIESISVGPVDSELTCKDVSVKDLPSDRVYICSGVLAGDESKVTVTVKGQPFKISLKTLTDAKVDMELGTTSNGETVKAKAIMGDKWVIVTKDGKTYGGILSTSNITAPVYFIVATVEAATDSTKDKETPPVIPEEQKPTLPGQSTAVTDKLAQEVVKRGYVVMPKDMRPGGPGLMVEGKKITVTMVTKGQRVFPDGNDAAIMNNLQGDYSNYAPLGLAKGDSNQFNGIAIKIGNDPEIFRELIPGRYLGDTWETLSSW